MSHRFPPSFYMMFPIVGMIVALPLNWFMGKVHGWEDLPNVMVSDFITFAFIAILMAIFSKVKSDA